MLPSADPLTTVLRHGETILWTGRPDSAIRFHSIGAISLAIYATIALLALIFSTTTDIAPCIGVEAVVLLFFNLGYLVFVDPIRREKTSYEVTNKRIIIKSTFVSQSFQQEDLNSIKNLSLKIHDDGKGTVFFDKVSLLTGSTFPPYQLSPVFEFIEDPQTVYRVIEKARSISDQFA